MKGVSIFDHEDYSEKRTLGEIGSAEITFPFEVLIARKAKLVLPQSYAGKAGVTFSRARLGVLYWALKSVSVDLKA
ncbi:hypothetical protein C7T94_16350 [Pedobacter yulinensis]|uniref:Uncharacterized protein n=1 Tax=Pedobacter yulinensis TaxID=2126353 RepID=A0A2T3HIU3_9SPHI|nr:hypothetical protein C7T94_16350 [Pedobacter yulinensis]